MSIRITDTRMDSDETTHHATWTPDPATDGSDGWIVSWLPERLLTRTQAVTAMTLAEAVNRDDGHGHRMRLFVDGWASELELSGPDATRLALEPSL